MKLLDQDDEKHISESFRPEQDSSSFRCPMTDMNITSGYPLFVANDMNGSYIRDDSIFIAIPVDASGLQAMAIIGKKITQKVLELRRREKRKTTSVKWL